MWALLVRTLTVERAERPKIRGTIRGMEEFQSMGERLHHEKDYDSKRGKNLTRRLSLRIAVAMLTAAIIQGARDQGKATNVPLVYSDIVSMVKAGLSTGVIVAMIGNSVCALDTSPATIEKLKAAGG